MVIQPPSILLQWEGVVNILGRRQAFFFYNVSDAVPCALIGVAYCPLPA